MLEALALLLPLLVPASQDPGLTDPPPAAESTGAGGELTRQERSRVALVTLTEAIERKREQLRELRVELEQALTESEKADITRRAGEVQAEIDELRVDFESIATGIDVGAFELAPEQRFDLQGELLELIEPIIEELKDATEAPRQLEELRSEIATLRERERLASKAAESVEKQLVGVENERLRTALSSSLTLWEKRRADLGAKLEVAEFQYDQRISNRTSVLESTQSAISNFFRTRGLNLVLAFGTFFALFFGVRWLYRRVMRLLPGKSREARRFYARLSDVLTFALAGVIALVGALLVLYATGDWVLLGLALLFILGIAWASKTAIPLFLEQIRLLLDLGTVREHERLVYGGIPYKVSRLSMYSMLTNPDLSGGVVRLPLKDLIDLRSRPCTKDELWFPCKRGEWVLLSDGLRGKVLHQSPELVQVESLGGAITTFVTTDFLGLAPNNLSHGFRVNVTFGIDYDHQPISTTDVPGIMKERLSAGLREQFAELELVKLNVEFQQAGASSLDYAVLADWTGSAAPAYDAIVRAIQRILVDTCNDQGWVIPFTQITLHQAASSA